MSNFSKRLRELRNLKSLTLDDLAKELKTTKTTLSRYENNKRTPDSDFIINASEFFCVSSDYILGISDNPLKVDDLLTQKRISVNELSDDDVHTINSIIEELKNKEAR